MSVSFLGVKALLDVDLSVAQGKVQALIGPNGAGKSTLFNAITGVFRPSSGHVFFEGREITGLRPYEVALKGIGRTYQNLKLFKDMTVLDNVIVGALCGKKTRFWGSLFHIKRTIFEDMKIQEKAEATLDSLGLIALKHQLVRKLPYGQRKAIELARALAMDPKILLLDEPRAGMNVEETEAIMGIILSLKTRGYTIFLIEHDMRMVMEISDRISVLDFGVKIAEGTADEIVNDARVIKAYLGTAK